MCMCHAVDSTQIITLRRWSDGWHAPWYLPSFSLHSPTPCLHSPPLTPRDPFPPHTRVSAELLLDELYAVYDNAAVTALLAAAERRMGEAAAACAAGRAEWWKLREAALQVRV